MNKAKKGHYESLNKAVDKDDAYFLDWAIRLSEKSLSEAQGGPFGAVIVKDGEVIAEGWNEVTSTFDPTAHAEMQAIRKAAAKLNQFHLQGAVIYSSCEPCPMCLSAIYWAQISKVVYANTRDQAEQIGFSDALIYKEVGLHPQNRSLVCCHIHSEKAAAVFHDWKSNQSNIMY